MKNIKLVLDRGKEKYSYSGQARSLAAIIIKVLDKSWEQPWRVYKICHGLIFVDPSISLKVSAIRIVCLEAATIAQGKTVDVLM